MTTFSLGFERSEGMDILRYNKQTEQAEPETIKIGATDFEGRSQPSRIELRNKFLDKLSPEDQVLSPGGRNYLLLDAVLQRTEHVHWLPTQYLDEETEGSKPKAVYKHWQGKPEDFYEVQQTDQTTRRIRNLYQEWMQTEKERVAVSNSLTQLLRRLRDRVLLLDVSEEEFMKDYVAENKGLAQKLARSLGHRPNLPKAEEMLRKEGFNEPEIETICSDWGKFRKVLSQELVEDLEGEARSLYRAYLQSKERPVSEAEKEVKQRRLRFLTRREEELEKQVDQELGRSVLAEIKEEFTGIGPRFLGAAVTHIRSPLLYESVNSLLSLFNFLPHKGRRRTRKEAVEMGGARFEAETKFGFEWPNQPAFFSNEDLVRIYRSYKLWRWLVYEPLYQISQEVFGLKPDDRNTLDAPPKKIKDIARRLYHLRDDLPIIERNREVKNKLKRIWGTGSPKELKDVLGRLVTDQRRSQLLEQVGLSMSDLQQQIDKPGKGNKTVKKWAQQMLEYTDNPKLANALVGIRGSGSGSDLWEIVSRQKGCHNIQMRPSRLESIARREVGKQAVKYVYYEWLDKSLWARINAGSEVERELKQRFKEDGNYRDQHGYYYNTSRIPTAFELEAVGAYYAHQARQTAQEKGYQKLEDVPNVIVESCKPEHVTRILNF